MNVKLRYFVRVTMSRNYGSNFTKELDFAVQNYQAVRCIYDNFFPFLHWLYFRLYLKLLTMLKLHNHLSKWKLVLKIVCTLNLNLIDKNIILRCVLLSTE